VFKTYRKIHYRYDLKGSLYNRVTKQKYLFNYSDPTIALKDQNAIDNKFKIKLHKNTATRLVEILKKDCEFFVKNNIIDYSLLIGIHELDSSEQEAQSSDIFNFNDISLENGTIF
jgi:hypothetical protein